MWAIQGYIGHLVTGDVVVGDSVPIETQTQPTPQPSPGNGLLGVQRPVAAELSTKVSLEFPSQPSPIFFPSPPSGFKYFFLIFDVL